MQGLLAISPATYNTSEYSIQDCEAVTMGQDLKSVNKWTLHDKSCCIF